jgi:thioredoxin reductase
LSFILIILEGWNMPMQALETLPIAVIGGGPVGLAAAAHLVARNLAVKVYEAGPLIGANMRDWRHVRVFTPWRYCVDPAATTLLERQGWRLPPADLFPTGGEIVANYLEPLAATPELAGVIETSARVTAISRLGLDKVVSRGREERPFCLSVGTADGSRRDLAWAVIDASGTWASPNPLGASGLPADGEAEFVDRIAYGIPDVVGRDRALYAGRMTLVVGAGHSAANALLDLAGLSETVPSTSAIWGQPAAPTSRASMAAAMPTSCRHAASLTLTPGSWSKAGGCALSPDSRSSLCARMVIRSLWRARQPRGRKQSAPSTGLLRQPASDRTYP